MKSTYSVLMTRVVEWPEKEAAARGGARGAFSTTVLLLFLSVSLSFTGSSALERCSAVRELRRGQCVQR